MKLFNKIIEHIANEFMLSNSKESKRLCLLLAISIYWDNEVVDAEIDKASEILRVSFSSLGVHNDELELMRQILLNRLESYRADRSIFLMDKKEMLSFIEMPENSKYRKMMISVFEADGVITESEKMMIDNFKKKELS